MESFESIFDAETRRRLVGSLVLACGDRDLAEEAAQDALATAWSQWRRVQRKGSPQAWVWRCAFNRVTSLSRRRSAERRAIKRLPTWPPSLPETSDVIALRRAVLTLPKRQRLAIICRYYAGLSVGETAQAMDCREGTVKALTSQAIERLRGMDLIERTDDVNTSAETGGSLTNAGS